MHSNDVIVYGGGGNSPHFLDALSRSGKNVTLIVDRYSARTEIDGIPVVRPGDGIDRSLPVYVSVSGISAAIARELEGSGHERVHDFNASVKTLPGLLERFLPAMPWYTPDDGCLVDDAEADALARRLEDETSRAVLESLRAFRKHLDAEHYLESDGQLQYFPDDVPLFDTLDELRFVDCGAFTGDTLASVLRYGASRALPVRSICLFEPERGNLEGLNEAVVEHASADCDLVVIPCGVWSENTIVELSGNSSSSKITTEGSLASGRDAPVRAVRRIAAVKLDHTVRGMRPNYVKMDIEGAERNALEGATEVIREHRPALAICVYHAADDLWEIPKLIERIQPGYAFYLRSHGDTGLETVLYAVPRR